MQKIGIRLANDIVWYIHRVDLTLHKLLQGDLKTTTYHINSGKDYVADTNVVVSFLRDSCLSLEYESVFSLSISPRVQTGELGKWSNLMNVYGSKNIELTQISHLFKVLRFSDKAPSSFGLSLHSSVPLFADLMEKGVNLDSKRSMFCICLGFEESLWVSDRICSQIEEVEDGNEDDGRRTSGSCYTRSLSYISGNSMNGQYPYSCQRTMPYAYKKDIKGERYYPSRPLLHIHAYERSSRVYNYTLDPCGPVHITTRDSGNQENVVAEYADEPSNRQPPEYNAYRESSITYTVNWSIMEIFRPDFLRRPTVTDVEKLYAFHEEKHGFPGLLGSLNCTDCEWFGCPQAYKGKYRRRDHGSNSFILLEVVASRDLWI
ncbi:ALP1-like protein isoform X1 [Tanacetum coccineum]